MSREKKNFFNSAMLVVVGWAWLLGLRVIDAQAAGSDAPLASQRLESLQHQQPSSDQHRQALKCQSCLSQEATLYPKSQQQFSTKNYSTYSFLGIKNAWLGKKVFCNDAPSTWSGSEKQLEEKVFPTKNLAGASRTMMGRGFEAHAYPTKIFYSDVKAPSNLVEKYQQALREKKSPQEARAMLEKEMQ